MSIGESPRNSRDGNDAVTTAASEDIAEKRAAYEIKAQELREAIARKIAMIERVKTIVRAEQAAKADAEAARQQWSAKLRDSDGALSRDIQKLRVTERSALSLMDEYQEMQQELSPMLASHDLNVAGIAQQGT